MATHFRKITGYGCFLFLLMTLCKNGFTQEPATVTATAMSLEKAFLAVAYAPSDDVVVYSTHNTHELARLSGQSTVDCIFFNETYGNIILLRPDKVEIWDDGTFTKVAEIPLDRATGAVTYSKATHTIAYRNSNDEIVLLNLADKQQLSMEIGSEALGEDPVLAGAAIKLDQKGEHLYLGTKYGIIKYATADLSIESTFLRSDIDAFDVFDETMVVMGRQGIPGGLAFYNTATWQYMLPDKQYVAGQNQSHLQLINDHIAFIAYPDKMTIVGKNGFDTSIKLPHTPLNSMFVSNAGILANDEQEVVFYDIEGNISCRIKERGFPEADESADGEIVVNQSGDDQDIIGYATNHHRLKVYNTASQKLIQSIPTGEKSFAQCLQISASNALAAAIFSDQKKVKVYDLESGALIDSVLFEKAPTALKISNDWMVVGMEDGQYASWRIAPKKLTAVKGLSVALSHPVSAIEIAGNTAIIASYTRMLHVSLDKSDFKETLMVGHDNYINHLSLDPSGNYLASSDVLDHVFLWDFKDNTLLETYQVPEVKSIRLTDSLAIVVHTASGQQLLDNRSLAQRKESTRPEVVLQTSNTGGVGSLAISPDGKFFASIDGNVVKVRDLKTSFLVSQFTPRSNIANDIVFTKDSKIVVVVGGSSIEYFDCITGKSRKYQDLSARNRSLHTVTSFPRSNALVVNNDHGWHNPLFIHTNTGVLLGELYFNENEEQDKTVKQVEISNDEQYLATYGSHYIKIFKLDPLNLNNIEQLVAIPREGEGEGYNETMRSYLSFSEDSRFLSFFQFGDGVNHLIVYDIPNRKEHLRTWGNMSVFGKNHQLLYMSTPTDLTTTDLDDHSKQELTPKSDHFQLISALGYDKNSNIFISGDNWGNLKLWNAQSGNALTEINRFDYDVYQSEMTNDGRFMVYNSKNGLYLFDLVSFKNIKLEGNNFPLITTFSPDSKYVYYRKDDSFYAYNLATNEVKCVLQFDGSAGKIEYGKPIISDDGLHFMVDLKREGREVCHIYNLPDFSLRDTLSRYSISPEIDSFVPYSMLGDDVYGVSIGHENSELLFTQYGSYNLHTQEITLHSNKSRHQLLDNGFRDKLLHQNMKVNTLSKNKKWYAYQENYHLKIEALNDNKVRLDQDFDVFDVTCGRFTPDENYFILGLRNGYIRIYSTATFTPVKEIYIGNGEVMSIEANARFLTVAGEDKIRHVFDITKNFEKVYSLAFMHDGDFVIMDPEGYYFATQGAIKSIAFKRGQEIYPFEQFDLYYNRPDKVAEKLVPYGLKDRAMVQAYREAFHKRLSRSGLKEERLSVDLRLPVVHINTAEIPVAVQDETFSFAVQATDEASTIDKMHIWVNDVPIYGGSGREMTGQQHEISTDITINLISGKNKVQVAVTNANGVESLKETFVVNCDVTQQKPTLHLISIGVSTYQDAQYNLQYAVKDATDIGLYAQTLTDKYKEVKVYNIFDEEATTENILAVKEQLASANTNDLVIVFFAGHGLLDDKLNYYLATYDVDFDNPSAKGLPYEALESLLDGIRPFQKLLLIDACHSGEVDKDDVVVLQTAAVSSDDTAVLKRGSVPIASKSKKLGLKNSFELMQTIFADVRRGTGAVVISASGGLEYALESNQWNNGVFTYSLLEGLKSGNADANNDGSIQVSELKDYITEKVTAYTNGGQTPTARKVNLEFDFDVW